MSQEIPKQYDPSRIENEIYRRWLDAKAFRAVPDDRERRYVVMMPLPNVTGALHMGHAMDNVMQDLLVRWRRMLGDNTLWMPGTDHAGIATQAVVEKRLYELEGKTRRDLGREGLVARIWEWKDQYQKRIIEQQRVMGCSCDWERQRFTMDAVCARAVRYTFFAMFRDGLIYRGNRLVNWDCHLQTAVADDEIVHETVAGYFWHLRYPVIDPRPGEPDHVTVATTRPETMLGDTAVACHPDPSGALERISAETRRRLETASAREREALRNELESLERRRDTHLPLLLQLLEMARDGRRVMLPLVERPIPIIVDEWAKPELGSGCVKITPAHDPNDYEVWRRHRGGIDIVNVLDPDGRMNTNAGPYRGLDRFVARDRVVEDLRGRGLLETIEEREIEIGHSDRSKTPIEPYLSLQWFVRMGDIEGGIVCGRGTKKEHRAAGLAQAAIDAVSDGWRSPSGRRVGFHPEPERYRATYTMWLEEKRDWCIGRQLWWGHRIPIWSARGAADEIARIVEGLRSLLGRDDVSGRLVQEEESTPLTPGARPVLRSEAEIQVCLRDGKAEAELTGTMHKLGLAQDTDVLDTWFSSAIWPHSTLGWPDPATADIDPGQLPLASSHDRPDALEYYYPGSCLVTARDIITLWVARMTLTGLYNLGDVPFTDVFIHANILDGKGERMSKSKGNGIDPVDIVDQYGADAMRYVLCDMQTGTQDIRLPVQAVSPFTGERIDLATAKHGRSIFTYLDPVTGKEFDVLGTMPDVPAAKLVSDRFEAGRNFCNKLWNAARFALMNLEAATFTPRKPSELAVEDRWILSRLQLASLEVGRALENYNPSAALGTAREFFWSELCDWYLELIKPRMRAPESAALARQVLAFAMDQVLRLLHPFMPFITEELWQRLGTIAPERGITAAIEVPELLITARWPVLSEELRDPAVEARMTLMQEVTRAIRDVRGRYTVPPRDRLTAHVKAAGPSAAALRGLEPHVEAMAGLETLEMGSDFRRTPDAATAVARDVEIYLPGVIDVEHELERLAQKRDKLGRDVTSSRRKLDNPGFVSKANPAVVEKERQKLADLEAQLRSVESALGELQQ